ncbi:MAG: hypothetical protein OEO79_15640 [Gemmatimonadota bacterium]|nr:hypothetical protein [Gemmatimonadota bacterium]MDH3424806.1 hypothetical protein [Gemmatimonadota bacterium]
MTRTVVAYLAVGFAVLEVTWFAVPRVGWVEEVGRVVTGIIVLGFPLATVLAWTYDLTPDGIVRTPEDAAATPSEAPEEAARRRVWILLCVGGVIAGLVFRSLRL